jgi:hypothetical protein
MRPHGQTKLGFFPLPVSATPSWWRLVSICWISRPSSSMSRDIHCILCGKPVAARGESAKDGRCG